MTSGFPEEQLVQNRSAVLLSGGNDADRRAWAEESAQWLREDGALTTVTNEAELPAALTDGRRVVFVPDVGTFSSNTQVLLLKTLLERDDRPKLILGLGVPPMDARLKGKLRDDLAYRLQVTQVDLSTQGLRAALKDRRAKLERELQKRQAERERAAREAERQAKANARANAEAARAQAEALRKQLKLDRANEKQAKAAKVELNKAARKPEPKQAERKAAAPRKAVKAAKPARLKARSRK